MKFKLLFLALFTIFTHQSIWTVYNGLGSIINDNPDLNRLLNTGICPGCKLQDAQILFEVLSNANLAGANLSSANLTASNLKNANLNKAKLNIARLNLGILNGANLDNVVAEKVSLRDAYFNDGSAVNGDFRQASLNGTEVRQTDFTGAILIKTDMQNIKASKSILKNANAKYAMAQHAVFDLADLSGLNAEHINLSYGDLEQTNLTKANLTGANLQYANLFEANLDSTILTKASCKYAIFTNVNLNKAILDGADFGFANLNDATINDEQLKKILLCNTRMPDESISNRDCDKIKSLQATIIQQAELDAKLHGDNPLEFSASANATPANKPVTTPPAGKEVFTGLKTTNLEENFAQKPSNMPLPQYHPTGATPYMNLPTPTAPTTPTVPGTPGAKIVTPGAKTP